MRTRGAHQDYLNTPCDMCDKRLVSEQGLKIHKASKHGVKKDIFRVGEDERVCPVCLKEFATRASLIGHVPKNCSDRSEGWSWLTCQYSECQSQFKKYVGKGKPRKGLKYCSPHCSARSRTSETVEVYCENESCSNTFSRKPYEKKRFCRPSCVVYTIKNTENMGGPRPGGGRSIQIPYVSRFGEAMKLNSEEILVAEVLDGLEEEWRRNSKGFPYTTTSGTERKFYPDFYLPDRDLYVEYKGWITSDMAHKMNDAMSRNTNLRLKVVYGTSKRYMDLGTNLKDIQDNPQLLFSKIGVGVPDPNLQL